MRIEERLKAALVYLLFSLSLSLFLANCLSFFSLLLADSIERHKFKTRCMETNFFENTFDLLLLLLLLAKERHHKDKL